MDIYLPIAGMSINFFLILGIGGLVGFLSGLFGVGGGFLLTPLMMMIGIPPAVAAASDSNQIVAGGLLRSLRPLASGQRGFQDGPGDPGRRASSAAPSGFNWSRYCGPWATSSSS